MNKDTPDILKLEADVNSAASRLDIYLAAHASALSRSRLQTLIRAGHVRVDGIEVREPKHRLKGGETLDLVLPPPDDPHPCAENIALDVIYEDDDLIVLNKPAGLVVHPGAGNHTGTLVNALIHHCGATLSGIGGVRRPGIVHRLDKDTTGVMVAAKTDLAHAQLSKQFADHGRSGPLVRSYQALVWDVPKPLVGTINAPIGRARSNRLKQAITRMCGREAVTHYETVETFSDANNAPFASLLRCTLETGRTHQIRLHMAHIGHPVVGDTVYGAGYLSKAHRFDEHWSEAVKRFPRQALHASVLGFTHPRTQVSMKFSAALPDDLSALLNLFREKPEIAKI